VTLSVSLGSTRVSGRIDTFAYFTTGVVPFVVAGKLTVVGATLA
jgi:hypothetical protein